MTAAQAHSAPPVSEAVAAAESEIEQTRRRLDTAISSVRSEFALPITAVAGALTMFDCLNNAKHFGAFVRRNAAPLGIIALGTIWLAVQNRGTLSTIGGSYVRDLLDRTRTIGTKAAEAALSAAIDELAPPAPQGGSSQSPQPDSPKP